MRIVVVGATGTIGQAVVRALAGHDVVEVTRHSAIRVDLADPSSIESMYEQLGAVDAVVCAAGAAKFAPFDVLTDEDYAFCVANKLMGQVNLVRRGMAHLTDGGSFTLTSGVLARTPRPGSGAISLVNAALEGFTRAAALEAPRGIRVNIVSPPWIAETLKGLGRDPGSAPTAAAVARSYIESVTGPQTGAVIDAGQ